MKASLLYRSLFICDMGQREELRVQTLKQDTAYMLINGLSMQGKMVKFAGYSR